METFISVIETGSLSGAARRLNVDQPAVSKSTGQLVFVCDVFAPIPDVPETLREAAQLSKLVLFVGAGGSKLAACPDWDEFANGVLLSSTASSATHNSPLFAPLEAGTDFRRDELRRVAR